MLSEAVTNFPQAMGEPLYRVSTGNYEYRLVLRCRQEARARFAKMRKDVLEKIELLDQKHGLYFLAFFFRRVLFLIYFIDLSVDCRVEQCCSDTSVRSVAPFTGHETMSVPHAPRQAHFNSQLFT